LKHTSFNVFVHLSYIVSKWIRVTAIKLEYFMSFNNACKQYLCLTHYNMMDDVY